MRPLWYAACAAAFCCPAVFAAEAPADHYLELSLARTGGSGFDAGFGNTTVAVHDGSGLWAGIAAGQRFGNTRAELNLAGLRTEEKDSATASGLHSARSHYVSVMGNMFYDFRNDSRFTPYIGAGIGWTEITREVERVGPSMARMKASKSGLAFMGEAGLAISVTQNLEMAAGFRHHQFDGFGTTRSELARLTLRLSL